jgi:hypothetical protein
LPHALRGETPPSVAGTWDVTMRLPAGERREQWTIQQKGATITATAKSARGEMPVSGSIAGESFRVTVTEGSTSYKVRALVDGDTMDGTATSAAGKESAWHAARKHL